jgi:large subunit ribosomal protein L25
MTTTPDTAAVTLEAEPRDERGSTRANRLRREGWLPGVVYDNTGRSQPVKMKQHQVEVLLKRHGRQNLILDLAVAGAAPRKVILRDLQRDYATDRITHADFMEISLTRKIRVEVEIRLVGEPVGVSQQGGVLEHLLRALTVECLPMDIVREVTLDVSAMSIGDSRFVRDIPLDPKLTVLTAPDIAVASVQMPHVEEEKAPEEAAAAEGAEPAAAGEKKEGEAAEGEAAKDEKAGAKTDKAADKGEKAEKGDKAEKAAKPEKGRK